MPCGAERFDTDRFRRRAGRGRKCGCWRLAIGLEGALLVRVSGMDAAETARHGPTGWKSARRALLGRAISPWILRPRQFPGGALPACSLADARDLFLQRFLCQGPMNSITSPVSMSIKVVVVGALAVFEPGAAITKFQTVQNARFLEQFDSAVNGCQRNARIAGH